MIVKNGGYLYVSYYCHDGRLRHPIGMKADSTKKSDAFKRLRIEKSITEHINLCDKTDKPVLKADLVSLINIELGKKEESATPMVSFWEDWDQLIKDMRSGAVLKKDGTRYREASAVHYENVRNALKRYQDATKREIDYSFTMEGYQHLVGWLVSKNQSKNSIASIVKDLKAFFVRTYKKRHHNEIAKEEEFSYSGEESDTIALSDAEIASLYNLKLTGATEEARDVFVFGCWVALRADDLGRINEFHRRGNLIEVLASKNGEKVIIPLHWMARQIIDKYGEGNLPIYTTAEGLSYHLPKLCKMAGIESRHLITITKGGVKQAEYFYKYELVSPHTARRSFATNMYKAGFPVKSIMKITGHRTEAAFFRYIRIDKEQNAEELAASAYFNEPSAESSSNPSVE